MQFEIEPSFVEQRVDSIAYRITKWTPRPCATVRQRWHCHQHLERDSKDPIEPGVE